MPRAHLVRSSNIVRTARVQQLEGIFDVAPTQRSAVEWEVNLPIDEKSWNIGLIVGPSGCGKSTIAREMFSKNLIVGYEWDDTKSIVDSFPASMGIKDITLLLSSVGFSSPPLWLRPFHVLSNGEQFRVTMARALSESPELAVMDEFTSVIDREVAKIGSVAIAKTIRRRSQKFIAVSCHYDIVEWLQPDWIYQPNLREFQWRYLSRHPAIELEIWRCDKAAWNLFKAYHYLDTNIHAGAACFVAMINREPVAFSSVISFPHATAPGWRGHRTVCLPDYQGVGIGNALSEYVASLYTATGKPYRSTTGNPAMIRHRAKSRIWKMTSVPKRSCTVGRTSALPSINHTVRTKSLVASFEYIGPANITDARLFGVISDRN
jgi:ABC-type ATPase involved in cell division